MPKMTVLEMVQSILNDMDSDSVNSITDTTEAQQVADVIKQTYYHLVTNEGLPEHKKVRQLTALGDVLHPNYMQFPSEVSKIHTLKYNVKEVVTDKDQYQDIDYMEPTSFMDMVLSRNSTDTNIESITDFNGTTVLVINDKAPEYWTTFDDNYIVFDSYDSGIDTTLQQSKTICYVSTEPTWTDGDDDFIPSLDANQFSLLLNEAKSLCFINFKQMENAKVEQISRRQKLKVRNDASKVDVITDNEPNYGR